MSILRSIVMYVIDDLPFEFHVAVRQVTSKYQVALDIRRFVHENRPEDERYLMTLELSGPPLMEEDLGD
ncbi:hypothetical protein OKW30_002703 [Paraburkholderia sp. Clong3]|uniref:hypothetical protein n=1 Tax=unclassified Paraburkholderia TaxID=2615204 RepID=UPI003D238A69